jgi:hypothetical protein
MPLRDDCGLYRMLGKSVAKHGQLIRCHEHRKIWLRLVDSADCNNSCHGEAADRTSSSVGQRGRDGSYVEGASKRTPGKLASHPVNRPYLCK